MIYSSKNNELIKMINSLKEKKYRKKYGLYIAEGIKTVKEAVLKNQDIKYIVRKENLAVDFECKNLIEVTEELYNKSLSEDITPQGIMAIINIRKPQPENNKSCIFLDGINDPGNMGTIIRTAAACGYKDIYYCNSADPYNTKSVKASMTGIFYVNLIETDRENILKLNMPLITADMKGENIFNFIAPEKFCLIIGNEANGVSEFIKNKSDYTVKIPMKNTVESLNAAVSAGVLMYNLKTNI